MVDDVIISASPEILLTEICRRLGIKYLIASKVENNREVLWGELLWKGKSSTFSKAVP